MIKNKPTLDEIAEAFKGFDWRLLGDVVVLGECERALNPKQMAKTHYKILKANPGSKVHLPYYNRLVAIYKAVKLKEKL